MSPPDKYARKEGKKVSLGVKKKIRMVKPYGKLRVGDELEAYDGGYYWHPASYAAYSYDFMPINVAEEIKMFKPKSGNCFRSKDGRKGFFIQGITGKVVALYFTKDNKIDTATSNIEWMFSEKANGSMVIEVFEGLGGRDQEGYGYFWDTALIDYIKTGDKAGKSIYKYEEPKTELTLKQVADKFGISVESLRIKDE